MYQSIISLMTSWEKNPLFIGLVGGIVITLFNTLGSLSVLLVRDKISQKLLDLSLGFAAGLMLAASFTSLILPGIQIGGVFPVVIGIAVGALFFDFATNSIPHTHFFQSTQKKRSSSYPPLPFYYGNNYS